MPKKHDITIAGETYLDTGTLRMKGANSEEGKTIDYVAADPATITNTLGVVAGVSVSETNMELKSLQATKPSGPYIKITGEASGSGQATISEGYVSTDTTIPNSKTTTASVFYPVQAGNTSITGGALLGGGSVTPTVTLSNGNDSNMDNVTVGSKNAIINNYPHYFKVSGSSSATSSTVSRAAVQETRSEGYIYDKAATNVINADSKVVTVNAGNGSTYVGLKSARLSVSGGELQVTSNYSATPTVDITLESQNTSGVTLTNSQPTSGYYVKLGATSTALSGKTAVKRAAINTSTSAGYIGGGTSTFADETSAEPSVSIGQGTKTEYVNIPQAYLSGASNTSTEIADRNLNAGQEVSISAGYYDKTRIIRANSLASQTSGTAIHTDILPNKTAWVNGEQVTGSMPTLDAQTITPSKNNQYLYSGRYLSGTQTIEGDINLEAKNIKEGVTIFGVTGTYTATPSYKIKGTWRMDANKFTSYWPSTDNSFEQSLTFKVKRPYSETNIEYLTYNKMSFGYTTGGALKTIKYDSTLAYASSTYGGVTAYPGWQGENFMPGDPAQIIIDTEQEVSETFYNWFMTVANPSGSDEEITVSVGTLTIDASRGGIVYATIFNGSTITNGNYTIAENGTRVIENVVLNTPFIVVLPALSSNYYYRSTANVTELEWLSPSDHYTSTSFSGLLTSTTGSVNFWEDCCFDGGSKVLLPNGAIRALVDINIGDTVMSYNETTGAIEENKVTALGTVELRRATQIALADDTVIRMNIYHPLYTQDGWKSITRYNGLPELTIEDKLLNSEGEYISIKSIENVVIEEETYYTLKVEGNNNFYVNGILAQGKDKD